MTELDFHYIVLALGLLGTTIIYSTYKAFEYGDRMAMRDGVLCSSCNKRVKYRAKMLAKQERLKAKKRKKKLSNKKIERLAELIVADGKKALSMAIIGE